MKRRLFLSGLVSTLAAPAIVRADSLMRLLPPKTLDRALEEVRISLGLNRYTDFSLESFIAEQPDVWHHVVVTKSCINGTKLYVDNSLVRHDDHLLITDASRWLAHINKTRVDSVSLSLHPASLHS